MKKSIQIRNRYRNVLDQHYSSALHVQEILERSLLDVAQIKMDNGNATIKPEELDRIPILKKYISYFIKHRDKLKARYMKEPEYEELFALTRPNKRKIRQDKIPIYQHYIQPYSQKLHDALIASAIDIPHKEAQIIKQTKKSLSSQ
jgi:hypothetical protein